MSTTTDIHYLLTRSYGPLQLPSLGVLGIVATAVTLLITYVSTRVQSQRAHADGLKGKPVEPPQAPYSVPWLANTLSFAWDTEAYIWRMQKMFGAAPFRMSVAGDKFIFIPGGEIMNIMFKASREMNNKNVLLNALRDQFAMNDKDLEIWRQDNSGIGSKPLPGFESVEPGQRVYFNQHRDLHGYLMGASLDLMTENFINNFSRQLSQKEDISAAEWTQLPDLYDFLRKDMFQAALRALCGDHILALNPNFTDEFWKFDAALTILLRRVPRWLYPKGWAARDKALASVRRWHESARDHFDWNNEEAVQADWEPVYGARLMRARQKMFQDSGHSLDGAASLDLGMLWAVNANVIPASSWALLNILLNREVKAGVLEEIEASLTPGTQNFDIATLCSKPLLTSIYLEALRYCVAVGVARNAVSRSVSLSNWTITPDATALSISWFGAHDAAFWNAGPGDRYPVDVFWPERFLQFPDDPASGPIKPTKLPAEAHGQRGNSTRDYKQAKVVTAGTQGHMYPYGGGVKMCPGRFFAKQEMLASIALLLHEFEIEIIDPTAAAMAKPNRGYFPMGAMPPDRAVPVRIRRRGGL